MNPTDEMIGLLHSIDATLKELLALSKTKRAATPTPPATEWHSQASDQDLDSPYGDEQVKFVPRSWTGEDCKGKKMSECTPACLDALANAFDWFAQQKRHQGEEQKAVYEERSARRARGWAARIRSGWKPKGSDSMVTKDEVTW